MNMPKNNVLTLPLRTPADPMSPVSPGASSALEQQLADTSRLLEITSKQLLEQQRQFEDIILSLQQQVDRDALTGLYNRRKFNTLCAAEILRGKRYDTPMALIMIDIDCFKAVNDTHGHLVGDQVLVEISQVIAGRMRESDALARWGGEEFMILALNTDLEQALRLAEQIRTVIEQTGFSVVGRMTCSLGVTAQCDNDTVDRLIQRADAALYRAKHRGRNSVQAASGDAAVGDGGKRSAPPDARA